MLKTALSKVARNHPECPTNGCASKELYPGQMFISRVDRETSDDNMRDCISEQKINIINFERLSHDDAKYKSYKLIVSVSDYVSLYKPSQWPVGISISKYHPPKATEIQNNGIN